MNREGDFIILVNPENGDDVAIINSQLPAWYFTNQQGLRVWRASRNGVSNKDIATSEAISITELSSFLDEISEQLYVPSNSQPPNGGSIHMTNQCDGLCSYCRYNCQSGSRGTVTRKQISWYINELAKEQAQLLTLTGGQCLLHWGLVQYAVKLARDSGMHVHILSNGLRTLSSSQLEFLAKNEVSFQVSLDSPNDAINRRARMSPAEPIKTNIVSLIQAGIPVTVGMVLSRINKDEVPAMINWCLSVGAKLHFAFLERGGRAEMQWQNISLSDSELIDIFKDCLEIWSSRISLFPDFNGISEKIIAPPTAKSCSAGNCNVSLSPHGLIYPCANFVGQNDMAIGHASGSLANYQDNFQRHHEFRYTDNHECADCDFGWLCVGGCRDRVRLNGGTEPYCQVLKFMYYKIFWYTLCNLGR